MEWSLCQFDLMEKLWYSYIVALNNVNMDILWAYLLVAEVMTYLSNFLCIPLYKDIVTPVNLFNNKKYLTSAVKCNKKVS